MALAQCRIKKSSIKTWQFSDQKAYEDEHCRCTYRLCKSPEHGWYLLRLNTTQCPHPLARCFSVLPLLFFGASRPRWTYMQCIYAREWKSADLDAWQIEIVYSRPSVAVGWCYVRVMRSIVSFNGLSFSKRQYYRTNGDPQLLHVDSCRSDAYAETLYVDCSPSKARGCMGLRPTTEPGEPTLWVWVDAIDEVSLEKNIGE